MIEALSSVTREMALTALDALMANHRAVTHNIANHASEGYAAQHVDFEAHMAPLAGALQRGGDVHDLRQGLAQIGSPQPTLREQAQVALDQEVGELMKNTLHYQAVLTAVGRLGSLNRAALGSTQR